MDRSLAHVVEGFRDLTHLPAMGRVFWALFADRRVPVWLKVCSVAGAVYVVSPLDLIPDEITGIGYLDDIVLVVLILQTFIEMSPQEVVHEHCQRLGIDPQHIKINVAEAVTSSIAAVLPFVEGRDKHSAPAPPRESNPRYSANAESGNGTGHAEAEVTDTPPAADSARAHRYSAYSSQQG